LAFVHAQSEIIANGSAAMDLARSAHTRTVFDSDLHDLALMVAEMGGLVEQQITQGLNALANRNASLARQVIDRDVAIDALQTKIAEKGINIIAQRQPLANDLREIIAAIHISSDLERLGDLAKNISKRAIAIGDDALPHSMISGLNHMTRSVLEQVKMALDSYADRDIDEALAVWNGDRQIDALNNALFHETLDYMSQDPHNIADCIQFLFCVKNLERAGDHATNIAESVHYIISGHLPAGERPKENGVHFKLSVR
jgi:phosphate transport system protein